MIPLDPHRDDRIKRCCTLASILFDPSKTFSVEPDDESAVFLYPVVKHRLIVLANKFDCVG